MPTWQELDAEFRGLPADMNHVRLDYQWGAAGTHYRVAGPITNASRRFETLARVAGLKLNEVPAGNLNDLVLMRADPAERWYEALRYHSGVFEHNHVAQQVNADGTDAGYLFTGTIQHPAGASAVLATEFWGLPAARPAPPAPVPPQGFWERVNAWLEMQKRKHGLVWIVVVTMITMLIAILGLPWLIKAAP